MPINVVVDVSHHNGKIDFMKVAKAGIVGVIHKATQGLRFVDPLYHRNREKALTAGLFWGAYHFGTLADSVKQADHFLYTVNPEGQTLLVLDYEPNGKSTMTLAQAREFVIRVATVTGTFPGIYSGSLIKEKLANKPVDAILSQCFLWIAQYASTPTRIPPTWATWTFWQYTDGLVGPEPRSVDGIGPCDRDQFNGSLAGLRRLWGVKTKAKRRRRKKKLKIRVAA
ncbi:MAG TPA: glycoside hydrolase family 25 protein [Pyrinomonadaceae bacterium]|nr:glycoside hydrolase family 25 protein [Pyrinomonadaceae bacterium]